MIYGWVVGIEGRSYYEGGLGNHGRCWSKYRDKETSRQGTGAGEGAGQVQEGDRGQEQGLRQEAEMNEITIYIIQTQEKKTQCISSLYIFSVISNSY